MVECLEVWTDSGVNREEKILSTAIVPGLDNDENKNEERKVQNVEEEQGTVLEQPKFDEVENN